MKHYLFGEIRNNTEVLPKSERPYILLLSDDLRFPSGIGTMSREIVLGTCHRFNWIQVGGAAKHPEANKILNMDKSIEEETGVPDATVTLFCVNGYGDPNLIRSIIRGNNISAIMHFTDPRFWGWLYSMNGELKTKLPLIYLDLWDNLPICFYNRDFYKSCNLLLQINRQTHQMVKALLGKENVYDLLEHKNKEISEIINPYILDYVPHGINSDTYFPISSDDPKLLEKKKKLFGDKEIDFIVLFNNRNVRRKQPGDLIIAFADFYRSLPKEQAEKTALVMHTSGRDENGTDLFAVVEDLVPDVNIIIDENKTDQAEMNYLYNIADVTVNIANAEGFGLSSAESIMAGTMIMNNVTGGLQDQMRFEDKDGNWIKLDENFMSNHTGRYKKCGEWAIPIFSKNRSLQGSVVTPYIFDDRCNWEDVSFELQKLYKTTTKEQRKENALKGRNWMLSDESNMSSIKMNQLISNDIELLLKTWKPRKSFELVSTEIKKQNIFTGILPLEL